MHEGRFTHLLQPRAAVAPALVASLAGNKSPLRTHRVMEHLHLEGSLCTLSLHYANLVFEKDSSSTVTEPPRGRRSAAYRRHTPRVRDLLKAIHRFRRNLIFALKTGSSKKKKKKSVTVFFLPITPSVSHSFRKTRDS